MATMDKITLSESPDGDGIRVSTLAPIDGSDTLIHTAGAGTTDLDLVTLFVYSKHTGTVTLELKWGDSTDPIKVAVVPDAGLALLIADLPIADGNTITASASVVDVVTIYGYVNRIDKA